MKKLDSLTSLRFFAAAAIVIEHCHASFRSMDWIHVVEFDSAVSFFFVLSGFILTTAYRDFQTPADVKAFYVARVARIWPLHVFILLVFFAVLPSDIHFLPAQTDHRASVLVANVLLYQSWIPKGAYFFSFNAVSWSISTEAFFYLVFPALRYQWARTWHWKALLTFAVAALILTITTVQRVPPLNMHDLMAESSFGWGYISPFTRITEFVMGMLAASVYGAIKDRKIGGGVVLWTVIELCSILLIRYWWNLFANFPSRLMHVNLILTSWGVFSMTSVIAPAFAIVVVVMALGQGWISRVLSTRPLVVLGEASFALYLSHQLLYTLFTLHNDVFSGIPDSVQCTGYWTAAIGTSLLLWRFVETPCRAFIRGATLRPGDLRRAQTAK